MVGYPCRHCLGAAYLLGVGVWTDEALVPLPGCLMGPGVGRASDASAEAAAGQAGLDRHDCRWSRSKVLWQGTHMGW
jgi:hypothetical protein